MKPVQIALLALIVVLAGLVVLMATRTREAPPLPNDATHYSFFDAPSCMNCHAPKRLSPRSEDHPLGDDCLRCHERLSEQP